METYQWYMEGEKGGVVWGYCIWIQLGTCEIERLKHRPFLKYKIMVHCGLASAQTTPYLATWTKDVCAEMTTMQCKLLSQKRPMPVDRQLNASLVDSITSYYQLILLFCWMANFPPLLREQLSGLPFVPGTGIPRVFRAIHPVEIVWK